jgi:hypothetical protein
MGYCICLRAQYCFGEVAQSAFDIDIRQKWARANDMSGLITVMSGIQAQIPDCSDTDFWGRDICSGPLRGVMPRHMDEGSKGLYIEGGGPTYAARSQPQYISAFTTRVRQSTYVCGKGERA